jgi:hypothetical protein
MQRHRTFFTRRLWLTMPMHARRGLTRLYVVLSGLSIACWGYQIASHGPQWRYLSNAIWAMLAVPIGSPVLLFVFLWVYDGFRKQSVRVEEGPVVKPPPLPRSNLRIEPTNPEATPYELETKKNPSTALLVISALLFPRIWMIDFTLVSLYWVARLPK